MNPNGTHIMQIRGLNKPINPKHNGGDEGTRTPDPLLAKQMLSQLSYIPEFLW